MPTHIKQIDGSDKTTLNVSGEMHLNDAILLEKIATEIYAENKQLTIDLADLSLLDSDAATILKRIENSGVAIIGMETFLQSAIDLAERNG